MFTVFFVFICSLVAVVHSQTEYPYISFMGVNLPNHSYVDLTTVGDDISDSGDTVICHTDLSTCCTPVQGIHRGAWLFPGRRQLQTQNSNNIIFDDEPQSVHIRRRNNATSPTGIYRCDIETLAVNTITRETVFVGLYPPNEGKCFVK